MHGTLLCSVCNAQQPEEPGSQAWLPHMCPPLGLPQHTQKRAGVPRWTQTHKL
jgi:hypothetical protein